ncbi:alpha/beta fold hydrolase [Pseudonocardia nigra]|uniref:alpha/beta fold hydrolase n=1 Tax=Pseudonocardia nigra TaxID=1921578 RepID=UPI001C5D08FD|nr:alpha/beta hydrolase [Pseudonocardia nigra]
MTEPAEHSVTTRPDRTTVQNAAHIDVPALVLIGQEDAIFPPPSGPREAELIQTGSDDVSLEVVSPSSHSVTTEEPAPEVANSVSR